jgi:hypothetical protein
MPDTVLWLKCIWYRPKQGSGSCLCSLHSFIHSFIHSSMALQSFFGSLTLPKFRNLFYTVGRTPWMGISPSQGRYLHRTTNRINAHTDIHVLSGIRTHNPSVWASENSSDLRPYGHCDRLLLISSGEILHWEMWCCLFLEIYILWIGFPWNLILVWLSEICGPIPILITTRDKLYRILAASGT